MAAAGGYVFVLSNENVVDGNSAIWEYVSGQWVQFPGSGAQLAATYDPNTYTIANAGTILADGLFVVSGLQFARHRTR